MLHFGQYLKLKWLSCVYVCVCTLGIKQKLFQLKGNTFSFFVLFCSTCSSLLAFRIFFNLIRVFSCLFSIDSILMHNIFFCLPNRFLSQWKSLHFFFKFKFSARAIVRRHFFSSLPFNVRQFQVQTWRML